MKKAMLLALAIFGFGAVSQAASLHCEGNYLFHDFTIDGSVSGTRVPGQIRFTVSQGGSIVKAGMMTVTSSSVQAGKAIQLMARASDGSTGELNAAFEPESGNYTGTLNAHGSQGTLNVPVECVLGSSVRSRQHVEGTATPSEDHAIYW